MPARPPLEIVYAASAVKELDQIWDYNLRTYGTVEHAQEYLDFLKSEIRSLAENPNRGKGVAANPELRYILMLRHPSGMGHVAVYRVLKSKIRVLHVFHTSQDWQSRVKI